MESADYIYSYTNPFFSAVASTFKTCEAFKALDSLPAFTRVARILIRNRFFWLTRAAGLFKALK